MAQLARLIIVGAVLGIVAWAIYALANDGEPDPCVEARDLGHARLLPEAELAYERSDESCGADGAAAVQSQQEAAADLFARAETQLASARRLKPLKVKLKQRRSHIRKRKRARQRAARRALIESLEIYPFREGGLHELGSTLAHVPIKRKKGRMKAGAISCRRVRRLLDAKLPEQAKLTLSRSARRGLRPLCAEQLARLATVRQKALANLRLARADEEDDDVDSARAHYAAALLGDPSLAEARTALQTPEDESTSYLDAVADWLKEKPAELSDDLVWVLPLLALVLILGFRFLCWTATWGRGWRNAMEFLSEGWPLGWLRRTCVLRVRLQSLEGGSASTVEGKDLTALLLDALEPPHLRPYSFDVVSGTDPSQTLPDDFTKLLADVPHGKFAAALLAVFGSLFDPPTVTVSGRIMPVGLRGAGLGLSLTPSGRGPSYSHTVWERSRDDKPEIGPEPWYRLVPFAGAWLRWHLRTYVPAESREAPATRDWRTEAREQAALRFQRTGDWERAQNLYAQILDEDPTYLPAAHNLAVAEIRAARYGQAVERLTAVRDTLEVDESAHNRWPALPMSVSYNLSVGLSYQARADA